MKPCFICLLISTIIYIYDEPTLACRKLLPIFFDNLDLKYQFDHEQKDKIDPSLLLINCCCFAYIYSNPV